MHVRTYIRFLRSQWNYIKRDTTKKYNIYHRILQLFLTLVCFLFFCVEFDELHGQLSTQFSNSGWVSLCICTLNVCILTLIDLEEGLWELAGEQGFW